jgi:uncharacterized SAM-binding protein YcdF (DUF218 family)
MIYVLSKALWLLIAPTNALILITAVSAFWALLGPSKRAAWLAAFGTFGLAIGGFTPAGLWTLVPLESRFLEWRPSSQSAPNGIILLGGDAGDGIMVLAELGQRFPQARLVFSGPSVEASKVNDLLQKFANFGGDLTRIKLETRSRNTFENAMYSAELINPKPDERWLLVTPALHMPRSIGTFRRAGFKVEAYPILFRTKDTPNSFFESGAGSTALGHLDAAAKEWMGLVAYRIMGKTDALFPAP